MAGPGTGADRAYKAEVSLASSQFCVVVAGSNDGGMKLPAAAGEGRILGVLLDYPANAQFGRVRKQGIATVILAGTVAYGDSVEIANTSGHVRKHSAQGNAIVGQTEMAGVSGDQIEIHINTWPGDIIHPAS